MKFRKASTLTDSELTDLLKTDGYTAFSEIYNRYWDKLFVVANNRLQDRQEAEEAVQHIFVALWNRRAKLELTYSMATYLSVAVKYQVFTRIAKKKREKTYAQTLQLQVALGAETTSDWLSEKELKWKIEQCVQALPAKCKIVFQLSRKEHMTNAQIAAQLNISEKTVEGHVTKALNSLRNSLNISIPLLLLLLKK